MISATICNFLRLSANICPSEISRVPGEGKELATNYEYQRDAALGVRFGALCRSVPLKATRKSLQPDNPNAMDDYVNSCRRRGAEKFGINMGSQHPSPDVKNPLQARAAYLVRNQRIT